jgi:hypothetical protein
MLLELMEVHVLYINRVRGGMVRGRKHLVLRERGVRRRRR